ncbi:hypothetical protein A1F94_001823 [Pyrenophora tritici-repentis]|nr:hypothetical protein A1F94_001823 [Pyrenophora tritici-repentis]
MSRANQWFVPGDGIAREVITADIQRYLGPDALVRPGTGTGEYQGQPGYWITAYRTLTSQMIQDLKMDSQRWQQERQPGETGRGGSHSPQVRTTKVSGGPNASLVAYQDSRTHAARQHWGPTKPYEHGAPHAAADPYDQPPRQSSTSSRATTYSSSGYASSDPPLHHHPNHVWSFTSGLPGRIRCTQDSASGPILIFLPATQWKGIPRPGWLLFLPRADHRSLRTTDGTSHAPICCSKYSGSRPRLLHCFGWSSISIIATAAIVAQSTLGHL